jgi:transmembrane sensor
MTLETEITPTVGEQAAHWWEVLRSEDISATEHREFAEWVTRSPERVAAYLHIARLHKSLREPGIRWPITSAAELIAAAKAAPSDVLPLPVASVTRAPTDHREHRNRVQLAWGLAAVLVLAVGIAWTAWLRPREFQTRFGEQRSVLLEDGSRVTLNTSSKIEVRLQRHRRVIRLLEGEALFEVAHDSSRPFDVLAEHTVLRAVGTQFDVDVRRDRTIVTIVEGVVQWTPTSASAVNAARVPLIANDRLVVAADGAIAAQHGVNTAAATSWTRHQLVFEHRPLGEVAEEFNRYSREQIEISAPQLRDRAITGVFQANDSASFRAFLSSLPGVAVRDVGDGRYVVTVVATRP